MQTYSAIPEIMQNPRVFSHYPASICRLLTDLYTVGPDPAVKLSRRLLKGVRRDFLSLATIKDLWSLRRI
jgi:hypothetical protein